MFVYTMLRDYDIVPGVNTRRREKGISCPQVAIAVFVFIRGAVVWRAV